jgi:hypothetical protein
MTGINVYGTMYVKEAKEAKVGMTADGRGYKMQSINGYFRKSKANKSKWKYNFINLSVIGDPENPGWNNIQDGVEIAVLTGQLDVWYKGEEEKDLGGITVYCNIADLRVAVNNRQEEEPVESTADVIGDDIPF